MGQNLKSYADDFIIIFGTIILNRNCTNRNLAICLSFSARFRFDRKICSIFPFPAATNVNKKCLEIQIVLDSKLIEISKSFLCRTYQIEDFFRATFREYLELHIDCDVNLESQ